jgi:hypothetical protein
MLATKRLSLMAMFLISTMSTWEPAAADNTIFADVTAEVGLEFVHFNGMTGKYYIPEVTGQGAALLDYDGDGDLDAYLVQGSLYDPDVTMADAVYPVKSEAELIDRLYRNDLVIGTDGKRKLRFTDVTTSSGIRSPGYGMGVAAGDFDNDGWIDLYVSNMGSNQLFRNNGDGTFSDVTGKAGVDDQRWSTSCTWFDYNRDGWLDLYVANYIAFDTKLKVRCYAKSSAQDFCGPDAYDPVGDSLFLNNGDGTFKNVTVETGIGQEEVGAGLGVVAADLNNDRWIDLYVANDGDPNHLWINQHNGTFTNEALWAGAAVNSLGAPEASMGVDAGDFDGDGDDDLFMAHIMEETNTLFVNDGQAFFEDRTIAAGLSGVSLGMTGFGAAWIDFDNDSWLDLIIINGAVRTLERLAKTGHPYPLGQANHLMHNRGNGTFEDVSERAGSSFKLIEVSRGAVIGDIDNDGDSDVLMVNNSGPARVLLNRHGNRLHWLGLRLIGAKVERDMIGGRVEVTRPKGAAIWRRIRTDGSYCSANDPRVLIGLGSSEAISSAKVYWPSGKVETWSNLEADRYHTVRAGTGKMEQGK